MAVQLICYWTNQAVFITKLQPLGGEKKKIKSKITAELRKAG